MTEIVPGFGSDPETIIMDALSEYVGDAEGVDRAVLDAYKEMVEKEHLDHLIAHIEMDIEDIQSTFLPGPESNRVVEKDKNAVEVLRYISEMRA